MTSVSERHSTIELYSIIFLQAEQSGLEPPHRRSGYSEISNLLPYQLGLLLQSGCSETRTHDLPVKSRLL